MPNTIMKTIEVLLSNHYATKILYLHRNKVSINMSTTQLNKNKKWEDIRSKNYVKYKTYII